MFFSPTIFTVTTIEEWNLGIQEQDSLKKFPYSERKRIFANGSASAEFLGKHLILGILCHNIAKMKIACLQK